MRVIKIRAGQVWKDKKTGDIMRVVGKHHDIYWNCVFERSKRVNHKMHEFIIRKYYEPVSN